MALNNKQFLTAVLLGIIISFIIGLALSIVGLFVGSFIAGYMAKASSTKEGALAGLVVGILYGIISSALLYEGIMWSKAVLSNPQALKNSTTNTMQILKVLNNLDSGTLTLLIATNFVISIAVGALGGFLGRHFSKGKSPQDPPRPVPVPSQAVAR